MNIEEKLLDNLSERRHARVKEICSVIDTSLNYEYEHTQNIERIRTILKDYKYNKRYVSKNLLILNGSVKVIPNVEIKQGFICFLMIIQQKNFDSIVEKYKLVTYEPDARLYPNL